MPDDLTPLADARRHIPAADLREDIIGKLSDTMDPENAHALLDRFVMALRNAQADGWATGRTCDCGEFTGQIIICTLCYGRIEERGMLPGVPHDCHCPRYPNGQRKSTNPSCPLHEGTA